MNPRRDTRSRDDITSDVDRHETDLQEAIDELEMDTEDVETSRDALDGLDLSGTSEAADAIEQAINDAADASQDEFDRDGDVLEDHHDEVRENESDLQDREKTTDAALGDLSDASAKLHRTESTNAFVRAKDEAIRDREFLEEQERRDADARDQSEQAYRDLQSRVNSGKGQ